MSITIWEPEDGPREAKHARTIAVYPLPENRRPVGFAPWPKEKKSKRKKRR